MKEIWIVEKWESYDESYFVGAYETEAQALAECKDENYLCCSVPFFAATEENKDD